MNKSPQHNQQTEPNQCKSELRNYVFTKFWKLAIPASVSENSGFHARENPSEETISERSQIRELYETINL